MRRFLVLCLLVTLSLATFQSSHPQTPKAAFQKVSDGQSGLKAAELACSYVSHIETPEDRLIYDACVEEHLADLAQSACSYASRVESPADGRAYYACLEKHLPDRHRRGNALDELSNADRESIESVCRKYELRTGPAGYHRCLAQQLVNLAKITRTPRTLVG